MKVLKAKLGQSLVAALVSSTTVLGASAAWADTTLTVWSWDPSFNGDIMLRAMTRYQGDHPDVDLEVADFGKAALEQKLQSQLASGSTQGLPDIVLIEDYAAQRFLLTFPDAFEPIGEHIDLSGMAPYKTALSTVDGVTYSMPFDSGVAGLFYRSADLEAAGLDAEALENITWAEFVDVAQQVEAATGRKFIVNRYSETDLVRLMLHSVGMWYTTPDFEVTAEVDPRFRQVVESYVNLMQSGVVEDAAGWTEYVGSFTSGATSGVATGAWITAAIKGNPDQSGEWAVAPVPRVEGVETAVHASNVGGSSWYVLANAPNKEETLSFLNEVWASDADFYAEILVEKGAVGSLLAAQATDAYGQPDEFFGGQPIWNDFATWLQEVPEVNFGVFTAEAEASFLAYIPDVIRGDADLDEALETYTLRLKQQIQ